MSKKPNIKPLGDRVLIQAIEETEQIRGGIVIPDTAKEKPQEAVVIAIGTGKRDDDGKLIPFDVKVGDKVIVSHENIASPASVRYGWASNPIGNLVNAAGFPASPFRTDDWK